MQRKSLLVLILIISTLYLFFGLSNSILYNKYGLLRYIPFIIIVGVHPIILFFLLKQFQIGINIRSIIIAITVLGLSFLFAYHTEQLSRIEIQSNHCVTSGIIFLKWEGRKSYNIKIDFFVNGKRFESFTKSVDKSIYQQVKLGDKFRVVFACNNPDNSIVKGLK